MQMQKVQRQKKSLNNTFFSQKPSWEKIKAEMEVGGAC